MDAVALRLPAWRAEGADRALAVGAGDMDDRRQLALGIAELGQQPQDAVQRQVDLLGCSASSRSRTASLRVCLDSC